MCLQEIKLLTPGDAMPKASALDSEENVARMASVSASSVHPDYSADGATDGIVDGYPGNIAREWATRGERDTATIRLTWSEEQTIDRVWLFDRPNDLDQVLSGMLIFNDGTTIRTGELPDNGKRGLEVKFPAKKVKWLIFAVDKVKGRTQNIGLAEIGVFRASER